MLGYHESLAFQLQLVSGAYYPGRSAWPSAVSHTSYGDSVPAAVARVAIIADEIPGFDSSLHQVICKKEATQTSTLNEEGLRALSCNWKHVNGTRCREFLNYSKLKHSLPYNFSNEAILGKYSVLTEQGDKDDLIEILLQLEMAKIFAESTLNGDF